MTPTEQVFDWIEHTDLSLWISRSSMLAFPTILTVHVLGTGFLAGTSSPSHQCTLSTCMITLDPVDSLSGQASFPRNLSDAHRFLSQHVAHPVELIACEARLAAE
jgi:hypothetical protein